MQNNTVETTETGSRGQQEEAPHAEVNCFRAINSVKLQLAPLTILTGRNNSGKSSLLEALALAFSAPKLTNWHEEDIVRRIIDDKLTGLPTRLLNTTCNNKAASITLKLDDRTTSLQRGKHGTDNHTTLRFKAIIQKAIRSVLWKGLVGDERIRMCIENSLIRVVGEASANALTTVLLATSYIIMNQWYIDELRSEAVLPNKIVDAISNYITHLDEKTKYEITPSVGFLTHSLLDSTVALRIEDELRLYLPNKQRADTWKRISDSVKRFGEDLATRALQVTDRVLSTSGIHSLYNNYTALMLNRSVVNSVRRCLVDALSKTIMGLLEKEVVILGANSKGSSNGRWVVYSLFRRSHTPLLKTLYDTIDRVHALGLLDEYNRVIGSLGLRDPMLREGEVYFLREGDGPAERVPASLLGDGTLHLLLLHAGAVLAQREPRVVLLLEEPETGLHPGYMIGLADQLVRAAGANTGAFIVLSTHSMEMIHFIARRAAKHGLSDRVKTVLMKDGDVYAEFRGSEVLEAQEIGAELRGV